MSLFFALLFIVAALVMVTGLARKIIQYAKTPAPLKIPTTPAPVNRTGVVLRLFREVVFFESLFKGTKWTWLFGWMFHLGLLLVLLRHLRYFTDPVWLPIQLIQPFGVYAGYAMVIGLVGSVAAIFTWVGLRGRMRRLTLSRRRVLVFVCWGWSLGTVLWFFASMRP